MKAFKNQKGMDKALNLYDSLMNLWDVEYVEEDVGTSYGKTHCIITGNPANPPLLLLHGVGDNSAVMWILNIKGLKEYFYCIAIDVLGGPGKSIPNENFNKKAFSQQCWLNEIVDHYKLKNFSIVGVSNGAVIAFNYALKEYEKIKRVVCIEGGMITKPIKSIINTLGLLFPEILFPTDNNMKRILKKLCSPNTEVYEKHREITDCLVLLTKNHNRNAMFVHKIEKYNRDQAMKINDKFYFLLGDHRIDTKQEYIDILVDGGFKYKVIKDAGHGVNHEQPEIVNNEIINFILQ